MIQFDETRRVFLLHTKNTTYAMGVTEEGHLSHLYWGEKVLLADDLPTFEEIQGRWRHVSNLARWRQEYPGWGQGYFNQNALKATFADGTRNVILHYDSHVIDEDVLIVTLRDELGLRVELKYVVRGEEDILDRSARIVNEGAQGVTLENAFSAAWRFPETGEYRLTYLAGGWAQEYRVQRETVQRGVKLLETKNYLSGAQHAPVFMLDEGNATELDELVYFGSLQWSGSWRMFVERDQYDDVAVVGGISDFDFGVPLASGESFETPVFTGGIAFAGFSGASRQLHRYQRKHLMRERDANAVMPVIINTYGTFMGNINEEKVMGIVEKAQRVGAEAFIIDSGWSGRGDFYQLGMGDWNINPDRFPGGLVNIADKVHALGMKFGLWMEPEMAHVESRIVREHPEWVLQYAGRPVEVNSVGRVLLNFALDEVWQDILQKSCDIIDKCHLDYFKMDFNRMIQEMGSPCVPMELQKALSVQYVRNLYKYYNALAARYPDLLIENCAGGGQRVDLGMTTFSGRINRSDNQDPLDAIRIHEGFTYFMLSKFAGGGCHVSKFYTQHVNHRVSPTKFQGHVAMMGSFAIGENLAVCSEEELDEIAALVARHKQLRPITHLGEIYRLASAWEEDYAAFEYVLPDKSEAALFVYGKSMQFGRWGTRFLRLRGLQDDALYEVEGRGVKSGASLRNVGLSVHLEGDMDCAAIHIKRI